MKTLSQDLRQRVVAAVKAGRTKLEVAATFQVSYSSVKRWVKQEATTGQLAPKARPGRARHIRAEHHQVLEQLWREKPDLTLEQYCQLWAEQQGVALSKATMSRMLTRLGWSRKKRAWRPASATSKAGPSFELNKPS